MKLNHFGPVVSRKVWEAKAAGKTEVSLTMEELEAISEKISSLDRTAATYFDLLSDEDKKKVCGEMFKDPN